MPTTHVLNQFVWPDAAPTAIYAEQLADELVRRGRQVMLVGTEGNYRSLARPLPAVSLRRLPVFRSARHRLFGVFLEYLSTYRAFARYLRAEINPGDVVVATSAPPPTPWLWRIIRRRKAHPVYWLQDYYPELARAVWDYPAFIRRFLHRRWDNALSHWDVVMKIGTNLDYNGANAVVCRNWPPFAFTSAERASHPMKPGTALYAGNLGYAHDRELFVEGCHQLHLKGTRIVVRGDGPGMADLPDWIDRGPTFPSVEELRGALLEAETHLVAAHPKFQGALFPSKVWNSLAAERRVIGTGFSGLMATELEASLCSNHQQHRAAAADVIESLLR